jgi:hypothetical protein
MSVSWSNSSVKTAHLRSKAKLSDEARKWRGSFPLSKSSLARFLPSTEKIAP